jgi:hypothetical protein
MAWSLKITLGMEAMDRLLEEKRGFSLKRVYEYSRMWNE